MNKKTTGRRIRATTAAALLGCAIVLGSQTSAEAAPPPPDGPGPLKNSCTDYSGSVLWQTTGEWVRARERACVQYDSGVVRPVVEVQLDWPLECSLSVGFPKAGAGVSCPLSRLYKTATITLRELTIPWRWQVPGSTAQRMTACRWTNQLLENGVGEKQPLTGGVDERWATTTFSCFADDAWAPIKTGGRYTLYIDGPQADVKNDGDGYKSMMMVTQPFDEIQGSFHPLNTS